MEEKPRTTPYPLRMSESLRGRLEDSAKAGSRSLHAEIVARLEASYQLEDAEAPPYSVPPGVNPELDRQIAEMNKRIASIADALTGAGLLSKSGEPTEWRKDGT